MSSLMKLFWQIFWKSFIWTYFFVYLIVFHFQVWYLSGKNKKFISVIFISSNLAFYVIYLNTDKWIYNIVWLLNTIFTNKLQFCLVLFTYKILAFRTFCFQLIVMLLPFDLIRFLTSNSFHTFEASTRYWVEIFRLGARRYLDESKNTPCSNDYSYLQSIWLTIYSSYCWQNQFIFKV